MNISELPTLIRRDRSAYALGSIEKNTWENTWGPACYWQAFGHVEKCDIKALPREGYNTSGNAATGLPLPLFKELWEAYQSHGFFPENATLELMNAGQGIYKGYAMVIPRGPMTKTQLKLYLFTYRYLETSEVQVMVNAYKEWLARREAGTTLWQCFHWAALQASLVESHGIFNFNNSSAICGSPGLSYAFAKLCRSSPKTLAPLGNGLSNTLLKLAYSAYARAGMTRDLDIARTDLMHSALGRILSHGKSRINCKKFFTVARALPSCTAGKSLCPPKYYEW